MSIVLETGNNIVKTTPIDLCYSMKRRNYNKTKQTFRNQILTGYGKGSSWVGKTKVMLADVWKIS